MSDATTTSAIVGRDAVFRDADAFTSSARQRLAGHPEPHTDDPMDLSRRGDHDLNDDHDLADIQVTSRAAAVLVPIVPRTEGLQILLTMRSANLPTHASQIAFPGGKTEPHDASPLETALREAHEEVGLPRTDVTPLGYLDTYQTNTGFRIVPVVALIRATHSLRLDPSEVDEAFEVPLAFLMDPANHQRHTKEWRGQDRQYYAMPWNDRYIWGATAGMLRNLQETVFPQ